MKHRIVAVCAVMAILPAAAVFSQSARVIDLAECASLALASDPGLRSAQLESAVADARVREMESQYVPSLSLQAGYTRLSEVEAGTITVSGLPMKVEVKLPDSPLNSTAVKVSLQQPLFTGLRIASSVRQAEATRSATGSDLQGATTDLLSRVTDAYWQLAKAKLLESSAREAEAQMERKLADVKTLYGQGVAADNDVALASIGREDARIDSARAASARELARVRLAQLIGVPLGEAFDIPDVAAVAAPDPAPTFGGGLEDLVSRALAARPELAGSRSRLAAQEAAADAVRAGLFPTVAIVGDYTLADPNQRMFPEKDEFTGTWSIGVVASLDVGRIPLVAAQEEQARSRADQAREALRRQSDAVAAEVVRAAITLNATLSAYQSLKAETAQAEESARYVQQRYLSGVALPSAWQDAQSLLARARLREQAGLVDCLIAKADLDNAMGDVSAAAPGSASSAGAANDSAMGQGK